MNTGSKKLQREVGSTFCGAQDSALTGALHSGSSFAASQFGREIEVLAEANGVVSDPKNYNWRCA
jgi:hypothetical protein